jgi:hypothetical protein
MPIQTFCVHASPSDQAQLEQIARQGKTPQKVACRARIVLMLANHEPPSAVADDLRIRRPRPIGAVGRWQRRRV